MVCLQQGLACSEDDGQLFEHAHINGRRQIYNSNDLNDNRPVGWIDSLQPRYTKASSVCVHRETTYVKYSLLA